MSGSFLGYRANVQITPPSGRFVMIPWFDELADIAAGQVTQTYRMEPGHSLHMPPQGYPTLERGQYFVNDYTDRVMMVVERPSFPQEIVAVAEAVKVDNNLAFALHDLLLEHGWAGMAKAIENITVICRLCDGRGKMDSTVRDLSRVDEGFKTKVEYDRPCVTCGGTGGLSWPDPARLSAVLMVILGEPPVEATPPRHWNARCTMLPLET